MSEPDKPLKSKVDRYFSRPHYREEKKKQKSEWKQRQKEKRLKQKRAERQRGVHVARRRNAMLRMSVLPNATSPVRDEATLNSVLIDFGDKGES